jgi:predicted small metal-binding protein
MVKGEDHPKGNLLVSVGEKPSVKDERGSEMAKVLRCRDVGMDCDFVARAETEEEILKKAAEHADEVHNLQEIPEEVLAKVRAAIRDE